MGAGGYRAAIDTVLLGAAVDPAPGQTALELGGGGAPATLVAAVHAPEASFVSLEADGSAHERARANIAANGVAPRVAARRGDAAAPDPDLRDRFDHVFFNPPFFEDADAGRPPQDPARQDAFLGAPGLLAAWTAAAYACLRGRGRITLVHRADRLADALAALTAGGGGVRVLPIAPRLGAPAKRLLLRARKGVGTPLTLLAPLPLHGGDGALSPDVAAIADGRARLDLDGPPERPLVRRA